MIPFIESEPFMLSVTEKNCREAVSEVNSMWQDSETVINTLIQCLNGVMSMEIGEYAVKSYQLRRNNAMINLKSLNEGH